MKVLVFTSYILISFIFLNISEVNAAPSECTQIIEYGPSGPYYAGEDCGYTASSAKEKIIVVLLTIFPWIPAILFFAIFILFIFIIGSIEEFFSNFTYSLKSTIKNTAKKVRRK